MARKLTDIKDRSDIDVLMEHFYRRAMSDELIGFIFTDVARLDLERHLPVIGDFWETIIFQNGVYLKHGSNPLQVHGELNEKVALLPAHFDSWLAIFTEVTDDLFAGPRADFVKLRAGAIASRMIQFVGAANEGKISFPQAA